MFRIIFCRLRVLQTSGIGNYIAETLSRQPLPLFLLPFIITTLIRFAQGSGTVAMLTSAAICAPIMQAAGANLLLATLATCVGAHFCSYFNDSYFWVTNRLMGISDTKEQIRVWTVTTGIAWAVGLIELLILGIFMH
jgi:GntP family gluconate:H+ symporter